MNPISLAMDGLLAVLLVTAVAVGVRLNGKLKVLRDSQGQFVRAVGDLDSAAGRAEAGLQALRAASEEAHDALLARIETARGLLPRMDRASEESASAAARLEEGVRAADAAGRRAQAAAHSASQEAAQSLAQSEAQNAARSEAAARRAAERAAPAELLRPAAEPIPFPVARREPAERSLAAALLAAGRIVDAESASAPAARPALAAARAEEAPAAVGGDRLARFVARRRNARP